MAVLEQNIKEALEKLAAEDNIPVDTIIELFKKAAKDEYEKKHHGGEFEVELDLDKRQFNIFHICKVVESKDSDDYDKNTTITLSDALKVNPSATVGSTIKIAMNFDDDESKIVASLIHNRFKYLKNLEVNKKTYEVWKQKVGSVIFAEVSKCEAGKYTIDLGGDIFGICQKDEQIFGERLSTGKKYYFYIKDVRINSSDWPVILSRKNDQIVVQLLKNGIPEIASGVVEIKAITRIPGYRTKILVASNDANINPVQAVIGPKGTRINAIKEEMGREGIDVHQYVENLEQQIINIAGINPFVGIDIEAAKVYIICADNTDSLKRLIGPEGKNILMIKNVLSDRLNGKDLELLSEKEAKKLKINYQSVNQSRFRQKFIPGVSNGNIAANVNKTKDKSGFDELEVSFD